METFVRYNSLTLTLVGVQAWNELESYRRILIQVKVINTIRKIVSEKTRLVKQMWGSVFNKCLEPKDYQTQCIVYLGYVLMGEDEWCIGISDWYKGMFEIAQLFMYKRHWYSIKWKLLVLPNAWMLFIISLWIEAILRLQFLFVGHTMSFMSIYS